MMHYVRLLRINNLLMTSRSAPFLYSFIRSRHFLIDCNIVMFNYMKQTMNNRLLRTFFSTSNYNQDPVYFIFLQLCNSIAFVIDQWLLVVYILLASVRFLFRKYNGSRLQGIRLQRAPRYNEQISLHQNQ